MSSADFGLLRITGPHALPEQNEHRVLWTSTALCEQPLDLGTGF